MQFQPIMPKRPFVPNIRPPRVTSALNRFATGVIGRQTKYPPPPRGERHRTRRGRIVYRYRTARGTWGYRYRRTGEYGRRWARRVIMGGFGMEVGSNLAYAGFVGGFKSRQPRQAKVTARIGWTSIEQVGREEWQKAKPQVIAALQGR